MSGPPYDYETDQIEKALNIAQGTIEPDLIYLRGKGLIEELVQEGGRYVGPLIQITARGIDVVEHPEWFRGQLSINLNTVSVSHVTGSVAIAGRDVVQVTTFGDIRKTIAQNAELNDQDRQEINSKLDELENELKKDQIDNSKIGQLTEFFKRFRWLWPLLQPLILEVLKKTFKL
jgi:hypothetical protein